MTPPAPQQSPILWASNAPWTTSGYGQQTALTAPRIRDLGHDIALSCFYGLEGSTIEWEGFTCYPTDRTRFGLEMLPEYAHRHAGARHKCLVMTLMDVWVMKPNVPSLRDLRFACWTPVDHDPVPPMVAEVLRDLDATVVAMTRFGEARLADAGFTPLYVPHAVDTAVFKPDADLRAKARAERRIPDGAFCVGMVAANMGIPSRKAFPQVFEAFATFHRTHPDAIMYLHADTGGVYNGVDLYALSQAVGIPKDALRATPFPDLHIGMTQAEVAEVYSCFDVLMMPSLGEGFGIPLIEAQACGVPVIATNWTAMSELCGAGWLVEGDRWYDATQRSFFKVPAQSELVAALGHAYQQARTDEVKEKAREFALQYDVDRVFAESWVPVLGEITAVREVPPLRLAA